MRTTLDNLAAEYENKIKFGRVNIDEEVEITQSQGIKSVPAVVVFKDSRAVAKAAGLQTRASMQTIIASDLQA